jgi:hypothetical protein
MLAAASIMIWTEAAAQVPSPDRLERITEFFNNEIATGKLPGAAY